LIEEVVIQEAVIFVGGFSSVLLLVESLLLSDAALDDPGTEMGGLDLFWELTDNERDVGSATRPFESTEESRVSDRPGRGLETILPGSWLPLLLAWLEADGERECGLDEGPRESDRPVRRSVANLLR